MIAQRYLPEIEHGEWSLVFLAGVFSHAVVKRAAPGELRVHAHLGGTIQRAHPAALVVNDAATILSLMPTNALYARVDGVLLENRLVCTEIEVTDPNLYFDHAPELAHPFASLVLERVQALHRVRSLAC